MRPEVIELEKLGKKCMFRAFKAVNTMAKALKEAKLTPKEQRILSKNLEKYQAKIEKKLNINNPEDNTPF
jgi:5-bromo-4-chloroindolyl phosphate hydrolysis protein